MFESSKSNRTEQSPEARIRPAPPEVRKNHDELERMAGQIRQWDPAMGRKMPDQLMEKVLADAGVKAPSEQEVARLTENLKGMPGGEELLRERLQEMYDEYAEAKANALVNFEVGELSKPEGLTHAELYRLQPKFLKMDEFTFRRLEQVAFQRLAKRGVFNPSKDTYGKGNDLEDAYVAKKVNTLIDIDGGNYRQLQRQELASALAEEMGVSVTELRNKFKGIVPEHWEKEDRTKLTREDLQVRRPPLVPAAARRQNVG
jgi:hypothetical protein